MEATAKVKNRYGILASGMLMQLCAGIIYMWSVFKAPVAAYLNWDAGAASFTSSVMLSAFVVGIIGGGVLQDRFGPQRIALVGSVLMSVGMILTSFVTGGAPYLIYLTYGVIGGLGVGFIYTTAVSIVQKWFPDRRGFASGMMVSAFGFSLVIFSPVAKALLASQGVPFTFAAIGILFLVVCVLCSFLIGDPPAGYLPAGFTPKAAKAVSRHSTTKEMLSTGRFYLIALSMFFILSAYFILNPIFMTLGTARGLSEELALLGVMLTGVGSASGRLLCSWLSDLIGRKNAMLFIIGLTLVSLLVLIFANGPLYLVCIVLIAFAFGGSAGVYPAITADHYGTKFMGSNYGCVMVGFGVSALVFPIISNLLAKNGDYTGAFLISAGASILSLILMLLLKNPENKDAQ